MFLKKSTSPKQITKRDKTINRIRRYLFLILFFLLIVYLVLKVIYTGGRFTITLDRAGDADANLAIYENKGSTSYKRTLSAETLEYMTNISVKWIPQNINDEAEGGHNGDNYIAYTFYIENRGPAIINYWYEVFIDDVVKNVDEAIRVMIFINDEKTIYAKANRTTGQPEQETKAFYSNESIALEKRANFNPGDVDKCTIVIWVEGDDPDCIDDLIGGEMKMHMVISEEYIKQD